MIILEKNMSDLIENNNDDIVDSILEEAISKFINYKKFDSPIFCKRLQEKCDNNAFLDENLKYPIVNPNTCEIDCNVLLKSYFRILRENRIGRNDLKQKALDLIESNNCKKPSIRLIDGINEEIILDLNYLISLLE